MIGIKRVILLVFLWFFCSNFLSAQYTYDGPWHAGSYRGSADFNFAIDKQDSVYNGEFTMSGAQLFAYPLTKETYFKFSGNFDQGQPIDEWVIIFGDFRQAGPVQLTDYEYRLALTGTEKRASGTLSEGKPTGTWTHQQQLIGTSQVASQLFMSEVNFTTGIPSKSFELASPGRKLLGRWQREGTAADVWTYFGDDGITQRWTFDKGALSSILEQTDTDSLRIDNLLPITAEKSTLPLGKQYFRWLSSYLFSIGQDTSFASGPFAELLIQNAEAFAKTDKAFKALGHQGFMPKFELLVPIMALDKIEQNELAQLTREMRSTDSTAQVLLGDTGLRLVSKTDDQTRRQLAYITAITTEFIAPVRPILQAHDAGVLQNLPQQAFYKALFSNIDSTGKIAYMYEQSSISKAVVGGDSTLRFDVSLNGLAEVLRRVNFAKAEVKKAERLLLKKVNTKEKQLVIEALEIELDASYSRLDSLILAQDRKLAKQLNLKNIGAGAQAELTAYSALDQVLAKRKRAEELILCMQLNQALVITLTELPLRVEEVKRLYTDEVWNNFTFTVMDDQVKDELVEAYTDRLIPYFEDQLEEPLSCSKAEELLTAIEDSHDRLMKLRNANTKDLEAALSRISDPEKILSLITSFAL